MDFVDLVLAGADKSGILDRMDFMDLTDLKDLMDRMDLTDLMELLLISADKSTHRYPIGAQTPDNIAMTTYVCTKVLSRSGVHMCRALRTYVHTKFTVFAIQRVRHV